MINIILYTLSHYVKPFLVVTGVILVVGLILFWINNRFNIHKKSTRYLGLLTRTKAKTNY